MSDTHVLKVIHKESLAPNIIQLLMKPEHPIAYSAGQYIMLGMDQNDLKPFSIACAPREDGLIECHIRNQDDSEWMQSLFATETGDQLVMQGPNDQMSLLPAHQPIILVAGGTGFAPMKALLDELLRQHTEVPIHFYWGARNRAELYQHEIMLDLEQQHANLVYEPVISDDLDGWTGKTGLVHLQVLKDFSTLANSTVYMCGPWPMMETAKADFAKAGLVKEQCIS